MKAVIVNMDKKELDKATQPLQVSAVQISIARPEVSIIRSKSIHSDRDRFSIRWGLKS